MSSTPVRVTGKFNMTDSTGMSVAEFYGKEKKKPDPTKEFLGYAMESAYGSSPSSALDNLRAAFDVIISNGGHVIGVRDGDRIITRGRVKVRADGEIPIGRALNSARDGEPVWIELGDFSRVVAMSRNERTKAVKRLMKMVNKKKVGKKKHAKSR